MLMIKLLLIARTLLMNFFVSIGPLLTEKITSTKTHYHMLIVLVILLLFLMYLVRRLNMPSLHLKIIVWDGMKCQPLWLKKAFLAIFNP